ncbi:MAG TPA: hypothetical protein VG367_04750 [Mucilaginibacter sp.]|jgi:hypothetical protein|nr:hypothetical protein [Mucilaginibacter sp.]
MRKLASVTGLITLSISLSGCGLMEDAFKAGVIFALIILAIIALVVWLARFAGRSVAKKYDLTWEEDDMYGRDS